MKLNIGSAHDTKDGFLNIDLYVHGEQIKNWDACTLTEVEDGSVDEIYASHFLEHISHTKVQDVLHVWHRKLKHGGKLTIEVPDLEWACKQVIDYSRGKLLDGYFYNFSGDHGLLAILFGSHQHAGEYHNSGFVMPYLQLLIEQFRESVIERATSHDMGVLIARCVK